MTIVSNVALVLENVQLRRLTYNFRKGGFIVCLEETEQGRLAKGLCLGGARAEADNADQWARVRQDIVFVRNAERKPSMWSVCPALQ
jgi:c-di-GMP-binding flagellar brake protein YcgR